MNFWTAVFLIAVVFAVAEVFKARYRSEKGITRDFMGNETFGSPQVDEAAQRELEDLRERIKAITNGKGVDVVYDPVGGTLAEPALRSMAWGGRYLVIGFAGGDIPRIPLNLPLLKGCSIVGVFWGSFAARERDVQRRNVMELWEMFEAGQLVPVVGETHPLADYAQAFESLATRRAQGKVVLVP